MTDANHDSHLPQKRAAIVQMTLASALHFAGYELTRSATIALFTSGHLGFSSPAAMPAATALVSPCSFVLLWWYTGVVEHGGPRSAIWQSTLLFALLNLVGGILLSSLNTTSTSDYQHQHDYHQQHYQQISQVTAIVLFVSQNALVQLLFTQHWAFLGSIQTNTKSWFAPIAGIGSLSSTLAAASVGVLAQHIDLQGLLVTAAILIGASGICANRAYEIAEQYDFAPRQTSSTHNNNNNNNSNSKLLPKQQPDTNRFQQARRLFHRVPVLGALYREVLVCQCLSSIVSFLFVIQVKKSIPDDHERASWTGQCYAWINGISGVLQFAVFPWMVSSRTIDPRHLWPVMPAIMLVCCLGMTRHESLEMIAGSFLMMKILEYSLRGVANEMVFASLDYESRFVGKEIIGVFANRLGKSVMAVALSILATQVTILQLSHAASVFSVLWFIVSWQVLRLIVVVDSESKGPPNGRGKEKRS